MDTYQAKRATLFVRERKVDHDGYCSDNENEPTVNCYVITLPLPPSLNLKIGEVISAEHFKMFCVTTYEMHNLNTRGSYMCKECELWKDISQHDVEIDIVSGVAIQ